MHADTTLIQVDAVTKRFGGVTALDEVSLDIRQGEVHALVGENGAGKSSLGKMIAGVHSPDGGHVIVDGHPTDYSSPRDALADGIALIAQELALVPDRSVLDNTFLGVEGGRLGHVTRRHLRRRFDRLVESSGLEVPADARVGSLRVADQQKVEILRALARESRVIVMDEPTAALTREEAAQLLLIIRRLRDQGTTVIYVSHFLQEVLDISDRVSILKDGKYVRTADASDETPDTLVTSMLGRAASVAYPPKRVVGADSPVLLQVERLARAPHVYDASFHVRRGEIVGIAGLVGSGRSELARLIFGADRPTHGRLLLQGNEISLKSPRQAIDLGIAMLPESRKDQGLVIGASVRENVLLPHRDAVSTFGLVRSKQERDVAQKVLSDVGATAGRQLVPVSTLSGGNQQKVALAKWLVRIPSLLIVDEPTRGVDVGAKRAIYDLLTAYAEAGIAILVISSELEEVLGLAHRTLVMRQGRIIADIPQELATEETVMPLMLGSEAVA